MNPQREAWAKYLAIAIPVICGVSVLYFGPFMKLIKPTDYFPKQIQDCIIGGIIAFGVWIILKYLLKDGDALKKAVLCGILSTEILIYEHSKLALSMSKLVLWFVFYFISIDHFNN